MKPIQIVLRITILTGMLLLGSCSTFKPGTIGLRSSPNPSDPTPIQQTQFVEAVPTSTAAPASCPIENADQAVYKGVGPGFCFLYPTDFYRYPSKAVIFIGPKHGVGVDSQAGTVTITSESLAGQSLQEYADRILAQDGQASGVTRQSLSLGTKDPALVIDGIRAQLNSRDVLIEHNGQVIQINFQPWDDTTPEARDDLERFYASLTDSWVFIK